MKFDKTGKYLTSWGKPSWDWRTRKDVPGMPDPPPPNYFHTVHGIQVDPVSRRVESGNRSDAVSPFAEPARQGLQAIADWRQRAEAGDGDSHAR